MNKSPSHSGFSPRSLRTNSPPIGTPSTRTPSPVSTPRFPPFSSSSSSSGPGSPFSTPRILSPISSGTSLGPSRTPSRPGLTPIEARPSKVVGLRSVPRYAASPRIPDAGRGDKPLQAKVLDGGIQPAPHPSQIKLELETQIFSQIPDRNYYDSTTGSRMHLPDGYKKVHFLYYEDIKKCRDRKWESSGHTFDLYKYLQKTGIEHALHSGYVNLSDPRPHVLRTQDGHRFFMFGCTNYDTIGNPFNYNTMVNECLPTDYYGRQYVNEAKKQMYMIPGKNFFIKDVAKVGGKLEWDAHGKLIRQGADIDYKRHLLDIHNANVQYLRKYCNINAEPIEPTKISPGPPSPPVRPTPSPSPPVTPAKAKAKPLVKPPSPTPENPVIVETVPSGLTVAEVSEKGKFRWKANNDRFEVENFLKDRKFRECRERALQPVTEVPKGIKLDIEKYKGLHAKAKELFDDIQKYLSGDSYGNLKELSGTNDKETRIRSIGIGCIPDESGLDYAKAVKYDQLMPCYELDYMTNDKIAMIMNREMAGKDEDRKIEEKIRHDFIRKRDYYWRLEKEEIVNDKLIKTHKTNVNKIAEACTNIGIKDILSKTSDKTMCVGTNPRCESLKPKGPMAFRSSFFELAKRNKIDTNGSSTVPVLNPTTNTATDISIKNLYSPSGSVVYNENSALNASQFQIQFVLVFIISGVILIMAKIISKLVGNLNRKKGGSSQQQLHDDDDDDDFNHVNVVTHESDSESDHDHDQDLE